MFVYYSNEFRTPKIVTKETIDILQGKVYYELEEEKYAENENNCKYVHYYKQVDDYTFEYVTTKNAL